jgi:hypothetical protein
MFDNRFEDSYDVGGADIARGVDFLESHHEMSIRAPLIKRSKPKPPTPKEQEKQD